MAIYIWPYLNVPISMILARFLFLVGGFSVSLVCCLLHNRDFFCMVTQVRVCAGHARPLADTAASKTLARPDGEIGGVRCALKKKEGNLFSVRTPLCVSGKMQKKLPCVLLVENVTV
jgi:hypothetical protein